MNVFDSLIGQEHAVLEMKHAASDATKVAVGERGDAMTHAWLITGPPGSGRSTLALAFAASLAAFVNFLIGLIPLTIVVYFSGQSLSFALPIVLLIGFFLVLFVAGAGLALSVIFIRFDDAKNIINVLLLILLYLTPVFYPLSILNENMQKIVTLNPLTSFLDAFRWSFSNNATATAQDFTYLSVTGIAFFVMGNFIFKKYWPRTVSML
jgi:ABC-type polysaccharide/polyol phosphate export permease